MPNTTLLAKKPETWYEIMEKSFGKKSIAVTFQVTEDCCMACTYCYQHNKSPHKMTFETAKITIDKLLQLDPSEFSTLIIEFIGGEPLMEADLIYQICDYTIQEMIKLKHPWLIGFRASICSNGLLYFSESSQKLFKDFYKFISFSVSIDGNEKLHDSCRVDLNNNGTYQRVIQTVYHYRKNYGELLNTKMTIAPDNVMYTCEALIGLINEGFSEIFVNCIFEEGWDYSHAKILYSELKKLGDYLIENSLYDKIFIRFFDETSFKPWPLSDGDINWCGGVLDKNSTSFSIDYKGDIYPCIRYMASSLNGKRKPLILGNIFNGYNTTQEQTDNIALLSNITRSSQSPDKCITCPIASGCAWCSGYNYEKFGTPNKRATFICCMHQAQSLANVYFLNSLYKYLNLNQRFKMYIPRDWALNIIDENEYNYLLELSREENYGN